MRASGSARCRMRVRSQRRFSARGPLHRFQCPRRRPSRQGWHQDPRGDASTTALHDQEGADLGGSGPSRYRTCGMASIRVVLAEDNALLREGISRIIDGEPDLDLVGRAADLPELLELIEDKTPQVVVTDIRMPPTGPDEGIQAASWLREHMPE